MPAIAWINGQLVEKAEARLSPYDHGFLYGDGVWEPFRIFDGRAFRIEDHLQQLLRAAAEIKLPIPQTLADLMRAVDETVRANERSEGFCRIVVTRGMGTVGPDPRKIEPQIMILIDEYFPFPTELQSHGVHAAITPIRIDPANPTHRVRTLGQPHIVQAKIHALAQGCLEAIFLTSKGELAGTTEGNLFLVMHGEVRRIPGFPPDVAADIASEIAREAGLRVNDRAAAEADLFTVDEVFLAGTGSGVIAISQVDGRAVGARSEGPICRDLRERFHALKGKLF